MVLTNYGNVVNPNHERKNLPLRDGLCDFGDHLWHWVYYKKRDMNHKLWTCFFLTVNLSHETTIKLSVFRRWRFYQHVWIVVVSDKRQVGSRVSFLFEFHPVNGLIPIQTFNDFSKMPTKLAKNWRYTKHVWTLFWLNHGQCWSWDLTRKTVPMRELSKVPGLSQKATRQKNWALVSQKKLKEHWETWRKRMEKQQMN